MGTKKILLCCVVGIGLGLLAYSSTRGVNAAKLSPQATTPSGNETPSPTTYPQQPIVNHYQVLVDEKGVSPASSKPLTLKEAWTLADAYAQSWSEDALPYFLTSSDARDLDVEKLISSGDAGGQGVEEFQTRPELHGLNLGQNGARRAWLAEFASKSKDCELHVEITDGKITYAATDGNYQERPFLTESPALDSAELISLALKNNPSFRMQEGKGRGFGYIYQIAADGKAELSVAGSQEESGQMVSVVGVLDQRMQEPQFDFLPVR